MFLYYCVALVVIYIGLVLGLCIQCETISQLNDAKTIAPFVPYVFIRLLFSAIVKSVKKQHISEFVKFIKLYPKCTIILSCYVKTREQEEIKNVFESIRLTIQNAKEYIADVKYNRDIALTEKEHENCEQPKELSKGNIGNKESVKIIQNDGDYQHEIPYTSKKELQTIIDRVHDKYLKANPQLRDDLSKASYPCISTDKCRINKNISNKQNTGAHWLKASASRDNSIMDYFEKTYNFFSNIKLEKTNVIFQYAFQDALLPGSLFCFYLYNNNIVSVMQSDEQGKINNKMRFIVSNESTEAIRHILYNTINWREDIPKSLKHSHISPENASFSFDGCDPIIINGIWDLLSAEGNSQSALFMSKLYTTFKEITDILNTNGINLSLDNFEWDPNIIHPFRQDCQEKENERQNVW